MIRIPGNPDHPSTHIVQMTEGQLYYVLWSFLFFFFFLNAGAYPLTAGKVETQLVLALRNSKM